MSKKLEPLMTMKMKEAAHCNDWRRDTCSIFRVPVRLRWINFKTYDQKEIRNGPYDPKYVSIGPYHHGVEGLRPMEEFKWRALDILISKSKTTITDCIDKMEELEGRVRSCYSEKINMCSEEFVEMMLFDACFILMVLTGRLDELDTKKGNNNYGQGGVRISEVLSKNVLTDLLMLENQIPFFILREFFQLLSCDYYYWDNIEEAALDSLLSVYPGYKYGDEALIEEARKDNVVYHHLLHLFCVSIVHPLPAESTITPRPKVSKFKEKMKGVLPNCLIRSNDGMLPLQMIEIQNMNPPKVSKNPIFNMANKFKEKMKGIPPNYLIRSDDNLFPMFVNQSMNLGDGDKEKKKSKRIPSVTELEGFGVKFKTKEAKSFMNLEFHDGVMLIPTLILYPYTKTIFHNIIAFEQCFTMAVEPQTTAHISHYVMLMDFLIGNTHDIVTLQENEIITNWLGSQDEVMQVFNHLRRGVIDFSRDYFSNIYSEVNMYRRRSCPKWWAKFKLDYCNSPWSCISATAAVAIIILSAVQAFFSMSPILRFLPSPPHT